MLKDLPLSEHIHQHCNESMERALLAERHPSLKIRETEPKRSDDF
ncbi:hypothetical protein [Bathymodiolus japonicus methanotrophic gill symbiont]|nr:hypothetical protein [Bathymodiolus japonicus methanotrophic gill symbiont]